MVETVMDRPMVRIISERIQGKKQGCDSGKERETTTQKGTTQELQQRSCRVDIKEEETTEQATLEVEEERRKHTNKKV